MTPDDGRKGRFKFDDTARKWFVRLCVAWTLFTLSVAALIVAGIYHLAT
jgi:hypothetical protein